MANENAQLLLKKYLNGTCTELERQIVEGWYLDELSKENDLPPADFKRIGKKLDQALSIERKPSQFPRLAVAASILLVLIATFYFFKVREPMKSELAQHTEILPGSNKAFLITAEGNKVSLTDAKIGKVSDVDGIEVRKDSDGIVSYQFSNKPVEGLRYNTIETPNGGRFKVRLPDGSDVWLNAASKLTFPTSFAALKERKVELSGEAYFEVAKDKEHPFVVKTDGQQVKVLGTHFNINSYAEENVTKTTLLEGSVVVYPAFNTSNEITLKPGQQSTTSGRGIIVHEIDANNAVAWKNGDFVFDNEELGNIMKVLARWYDVEISFEDESLIKETFYGTISSSLNISEVFKTLELTKKVHFKIEGRRVFVKR